MTPCDLDTSVPGRVIDRPETPAVVRESGIACSCGGKSLAYACRERRVDAAVVPAKRLRRLDDEQQI